MSFHRSKIDLLWSDAGDLVLDTTRGDLQDTTSMSYRALIQQVTTSVAASKGDWRLQPAIGANLNRFVGRPNSSSLGSEVRQSIVSALSSTLRPQELTVEVFPIAKDEIGILLLIQPQGDRAQIRIAFSYNSCDNKLILRNL